MAIIKNSLHSKSSNQKNYALLSVFDKTGIVGFARELSKLGYKIISTGGTAKVLTDNKIPVIPIQEITGNPESFDGRMKTISFQIESGILFDRTIASHRKQAENLNIKPIDIVVCNLYPFERTISKKNTALDDAIENIDVGGPTMIRAAAKNFKNVFVITDPKDYEITANFLSRHPELVSESPDKTKKIRNRTQLDVDTLLFRQELAAKAFAHLSFYDSQIAAYLKRETFLDEITLPGRKLLNLRYGENPHQAGTVYVTPNANSPFENLKQLAGRGLSLTNITDINAGMESVTMFKTPCAVVIKHNSPCGIALGDTIKEALARAIEADPESAFGGVIVTNEKINLAAAKIIGQFKDEKRGNIDIFASPVIQDNALEYLKKVRKTMGIYTFGNIKHQKLDIKNLNLKWIQGGFVLQNPDDNIEEGYKNWKVVTKKHPSKQQLKQAEIAWKFLTRIRSNAIIIVDKTLPMTRGIGTGQTSRVRSAKIALEQAGKAAKDGIFASDSFFPFDDCVLLAANHKIGLIIQQGGSINDQKSIDAANTAGIPMIMTGRRAFWH